MCAAHDYQGTQDNSKEQNSSCNLHSSFHKLNNIPSPETSRWIVFMKLSEASSCWWGISSFFHTLKNSSPAQEPNPRLTPTVNCHLMSYMMFCIGYWCALRFIKRVWIIDNTSWKGIKKHPWTLTLANDFLSFARICHNWELQTQDSSPKKIWIQKKKKVRIIKDGQITSLKCPGQSDFMSGILVSYS